MIRRRCQFARQRDRNDQNSRSRAEAWTPCARSLQHRELMAQHNKFQQEVKALAQGDKVSLPDA
jgi:hypothetical protein